MTDTMKEAMIMLFSARWNIPTAAKHCGKSEEEVKELFRFYCDLNPKTYQNPELQLSLLGGEPVII